MQPLVCHLDPVLQAVALPALRPDQDAAGGLHEQLPLVAISTFGNPAQDRRPPVDVCFGRGPSQAAKSRLLPKTSPWPMPATVALDMIGPIPGTVMSCMAPSGHPQHHSGARHARLGQTFVGEHRFCEYKVRDAAQEPPLRGLPPTRLSLQRSRA
jgi:hypothetical protein